MTVECEQIEKKKKENGPLQYDPTITIITIKQSNMRLTTTSIVYVLWVTCLKIKDSNGFSTLLSDGQTLKPLRCRESSPCSRDVALSMKPLKETSSTGSINTQLRFKNLIHDDEEVVQQSRVDKWVEENLPYFAGKNGKEKSSNSKKNVIQREVRINYKHSMILILSQFPHLFLR